MKRKLLSAIIFLLFLAACGTAPQERTVVVGRSAESSEPAQEVLPTENASVPVTTAPESVPSVQPTAVIAVSPASPIPVQVQPVQGGVPGGVVELYIEPLPRTAEQLSAPDAPEFGGYPPAPQPPGLVQPDGQPYPVPHGVGTVYINTTGQAMPNPAFFSHSPDPDTGYWCPVFKGEHAVRETQGYGVGTHYPPEIWGARDYAIDHDWDGIATSAPTEGHPIVAPDDGYVMLVFDDTTNAGIHLWLDTYRDDGTPFRMGIAHMLMRTVTHGQKVKKGDLLGYMGTTGESGGPHLDFQVWDMTGGIAVNIDPYGMFNHICVS